MRLTREQAATLGWWIERRRQELEPGWELRRLLGELAATLRGGGTVTVGEGAPRLLAFLRGESEEP
jgi:hypothetical protein